MDGSMHANVIEKTNVNMNNEYMDMKYEVACVNMHR